MTSLRTSLKVKNFYRNEASHVSTEAFNFLGEEVKNSEPFSYLNGWIGRKCEEVKIGIAEDKLIWESK